MPPEPISASSTRSWSPEFVYYPQFIQNPETNIYPVCPSSEGVIPHLSRSLSLNADRNTTVFYHRLLEGPERNVLNLSPRPVRNISRLNHSTNSHLGRSLSLSPEREILKNCNNRRPWSVSTATGTSLKSFLLHQRNRLRRRISLGRESNQIFRYQPYDLTPQDQEVQGFYSLSQQHRRLCRSVSLVQESDTISSYHSRLCRSVSITPERESSIKVRRSASDYFIHNNNHIIDFSKDLIKSDRKPIKRRKSIPRLSQISLQELFKNSSSQDKPDKTKPLKRHSSCRIFQKVKFWTGKSLKRSTSLSLHFNSGLETNWTYMKPMG